MPVEYVESQKNRKAPTRDGLLGLNKRDPHNLARRQVQGIPICRECGEPFMASEDGEGRLARYFNRVVFKCACGQRYSCEVPGVK